MCLSVSWLTSLLKLGQYRDISSSRRVILLIFWRYSLNVFTLFQNNPAASFSRSDQNMALLWQKQGPNMILKIVSSSILMVVLRAAPCQISHCWMYLLSPFSKNCQNTVLYSPIMVFIWSFNFSLLESQSTCPEIIHVKFQISGCIL